jgi:hypothetical protein
MRLSQANKILLGSCLVVVPLSFYGGLAIKEHYLAGELDKVPESKDLVSERAVKARIVQYVGAREELTADWSRSARNSCSRGGIWTKRLPRSRRAWRPGNVGCGGGEG